MVAIKQQHVSQKVINERTYGTGNPVKKIVIHQTGNTGKGANAKSHANLQSNLNARKASWHNSVDDKESIESFKPTIRCWATGDGRVSSGGNMNGYHIEGCINSDGDYVEMIDNLAKVTAKKLKEFNLKLKDVVRHFDYTRKNCPEQIMRSYKGISWNDFIDLVEEYSDSKSVSSVLVVDGRFGTSTKKALQAYFGTIVDGVISNPSMVIRALQTFLNSKGYKLVMDGSLGPLTIKALQKYFGMSIVDGKISTVSNVIKELQRRLNKGIL